MPAPIDSEQPSRATLRLRHVPESLVVDQALRTLRWDDAARTRVREYAATLVTAAREHREGFALALIHRFGLDTPQGVALMQLAESLPRAAGKASIRALIDDKLGPLTWRDAAGTTSSFSERVALHALDTLAKLFRSDAFKAQGVAARMIHRAIAVLSRQYVLGQTLREAEHNGRRYARRGYRFSYDMLGEAAMTDAAAQDFQRRYLDAIEFLRTRDERFAISVKLSALWPRFEDRQRKHLATLLARVHDIAKRARAANLPLTIDAEESERLELTLDIVEQLLVAPELQNWNGLGLAVQAYQLRAPALIDYLAQLVRHHRCRLNIRLVKGAYWDTEIKRAQQLGLDQYPIFLRKSNTDVSFLACARKLLEQPQHFFPQFATHNAYTLSAIRELAAQCGHSNFEFQRLHGMGEALHDQLLRDGFVSRIYAPIGPRRDLLPYLVRRLLENGASSSFVRQLNDATIGTEQLLRDPTQIAQTAPHAPGVLPPRALALQNWPSARGFDLSSRATSDELSDALHRARKQYEAAPLINGTSTPGAARAVRNPADQSIVGSVIESSVSDVQLAVATAKNARERWSMMAAAERARILERAAYLLEERAQEFIVLAVREAGKTLDDAIGEVREAVDFCRYYAEQCATPAMQGREALGVVAAISPWNFPLAIFMGQVTGALAAGNTVVAKPAEQTPLIAMQAVHLLHAAGIPRGALNIVPGDGAIGAALTSHRDVAGVVFTGSTAAARAIADSLAKTQRAALPFIAETGGINAMIVDSTALPEQVARDVLISAFQSAGQRCSALRILCIQSEAYDPILSLLQGALRQLRVGDPSLLDTDIGPLIDIEARDSVVAYLQSHIVRAQASLDAPQTDRGTFVAPSIVEVARVADVTREIFGPVLHVVRYMDDELSTLVRDINALGFGLTLGIHTRVRQRALAIVDDARVGNVYVNRHQVGAMVGQQPFGGSGLSGTGPKAGGPHYLMRLSQAPCAERRQSQSIALTDEPLSEHLQTTLARARAAQITASRSQRHAERIRFATQLIAANTSHPLHEAARAMVLPSADELRQPLPSIAGEENTLRLLPRGVLLCLDLTDNPLDGLARQIFNAVALGNGVLAITNREHARPLRELIAELQQMGIQEHLVECIERNLVTLPRSWITDLDIDGVVVDGDVTTRHAVAALLATRPGPLLPLLSRCDDLHRFAIEQTITINTAAAGGDPRLLALAG